MVALYWLLNRLFTYWFMSEVLPTLHIPAMSYRPRHTLGHVPAVPKNDNLQRESVAVRKDAKDNDDLQQNAAHGVLIRERVEEIDLWCWLDSGTEIQK